MTPASIATKAHVQLKALPLRALHRKFGVGGRGGRWTADGTGCGLQQAQGHLEHRDGWPFRRRKHGDLTMFDDGSISQTNMERWVYERTRNSMGV